MDKETIYFFDSHGGLWATCAGDDPGAVAFGPHGVARPADPAESGIIVKENETAHTAAAQRGRVRRGDGGFDVLCAPAGSAPF